MKIPVKNQEGSILVNMKWVIFAGLSIILIAGLFFKVVTIYNQSQGLLDINQVLDTYNNSTLYLSIKDDASVNMPKTLKDRLIKMGSEKIKELRYRGSYVAVIHENRMIKEKLSNQGAASLEYGNVSLTSSGFKYGSQSEILIDSIDYSPNKRGLNIVVQEKNQLIHSFCFDFWQKSNPNSKDLAQGHKPKGFVLEVPVITIRLKEADYNKILAKRKEALDLKILLTSDDDFVPAKIIHLDKEYDGKVRLKGDWTDHLYARKWSFRIGLKDDKTLFGMKKFNVHHPVTRNFIGEWVYHKALSFEDIMSLKYLFVKLKLEIIMPGKNSTEELGLYALV